MVSQDAGNTGNPQFISVIIPVYNEELAIGKQIDEIKEVLKDTRVDYEILVIDDGSSDKTAVIVSQKGVRLIKHEVNRGVGAARKTGLKHAKAGIIVMIDGDGTYPASEIPNLLGYINDYDMVVGARKSDKGTWLIFRKLAKLIIKSLAEYLTQCKIPDLNSGLRIFRKESANNFLYLLPDSHSWVSTITLAFLFNGYTVKYIPIEYRQRKGKSSFHPFYDTYNYFSLVIRIVMYFNPLKIFLPVTALLFFAGIVKSLYDVFLFRRGIEQSDIIIIISALLFASIGLLADLIVTQGKKNSGK